MLCHLVRFWILIVIEEDMGELQIRERRISYRFWISMLLNENSLFGIKEIRG